MSLRNGQTLLHYRIVEKIGEGGMGQVYRAEDSKLGRQVALKLLPTEMAHDAARRTRFEREARAVAALSHPNIVTIFAVEQADDLHFFTMELVGGGSLTKTIPADGMSAARFFELALPLTEAVGAAHREGIIHRDLKPDNIAIDDDGRVKVMDFGLAKLHEEPAGHADETAAMTATTDGAVVGTVAYMSPEQAQAKSVDARSDVFSLGIVLHEMVTGQRPFQGDNPVATVSSILKDEVPSVTEINPALPERLAPIVQRCLAKEPLRRYTSAVELHADLAALKREFDSGDSLVSAPPAPKREPVSRRWILVALPLILVLGFVGVRLVGRQSPSTDPVSQGLQAERKMIVVFPFDNLGPAEDEYFADGITDEIISRLTTVAGIAVISRNTAVQYDRAGKTAAEIAQDLGVDYVLEGTIRWDRASGAESRVRITPQLVRVTDATSIWAGRYDERLDDIFAIQSQIASQVVENIDASLIQAMPRAMAAAHTNDLQAFDYYLQAKKYVRWGHGPEERHLRLGIGLLDNALALDPEFALAHAKLSEAHSAMHFREYDPTDARLAVAERAADTALRLQPELAEAHLARGLYDYRSNRDYVRALQSLKTARDLAPGNGEILQWMGIIHKRQGRYAAAAEMLRSALQLDPRNPTIPVELVLVHEALGDYATAVEYSDRLIAADPSLDNKARRAMTFVRWKGSTTELRAVLETSAEDASASPHWVTLLYMERKYREALEKLDSMPDDPNNPTPFIALERAGLYWLLGEPKRAHEAAASVTPILEKLAQENNYTDARLGIAYAFQGRRDDAIRHARLALERYPATKDAFLAGDFQVRAAKVYTILGDKPSAIDQLERRLAVNRRLSVQMLQQQPIWDTLRDEPAFRELLERHIQKPSS